MVLPQFKVSGLILNIEYDDVAVSNRMDDYFTSSDQVPDLFIMVSSQDFIGFPNGKLLCDEQVKWVIKDPKENGYYIFGQEILQNRIITLLDVDAGWTSGKIQVLKNNDTNPIISYEFLSDYYLHHLIGMIFRYNLLRYNGIVVHASSLAWDGKGIMFSAPSGTGKSTHVKLWQEHIGDEVQVVNDDTPAVRFVNGKPILFGTPWSGNGTNCNMSVPLEAIVILEQADKNSIRRLSIPEALGSLMPRCFIPYFDQGFMNLAMNVFEKIVLSVPVYMLACRPDKEAVEMVYQWVR
ncbi:MAG TPA: hypothetical protein VN426_09195 [Syntrophomonadaceae bacterium]|nr:hypothetical protein [Syntrophomonadaceae bacterium]